MVLWVADYRILTGVIYPMYLFAADTAMVAMILVSPHGWKALPGGEPLARVPAGTHDAAIRGVGAVAAGNRAGLAADLTAYWLVTSLPWNVYLVTAARTRWRRPGGMAYRSCSRCPAGTCSRSTTRRSSREGVRPAAAAAGRAA